MSEDVCDAAERVGCWCQLRPDLQYACGSVPARFTPEFPVPRFTADRSAVPYERRAVVGAGT